VSGESVIGAGGIQWMTAGSGLVHAEVSSEQFKREGGREEVLQLWLNSAGPPQDDAAPLRRPQPRRHPAR
jgi:redox-sensitive bicupin YhaK (pirin superfamily)